MKVNITRADGSKVEIEGTLEEVKDLFDTLRLSDDVLKALKEEPQPASDATTTQQVQQARQILGGGGSDWAEYFKRYVEEQMGFDTPRSGGILISTPNPSVYQPSVTWGDHNTWGDHKG